MKKYKYSSQALVYTGMIFLVVFPLVLALVVFFMRLFEAEILYALGALYLIDLFSIGWLLVSAWDRQFIINERSLGFKNKLSSMEIRPKDILEITLLANKQDKEFLRIRTKRRTYHLDEKYQPWGPLLDELELFVKNFGINSNLSY